MDQDIRYWWIDLRGAPAKLPEFPMGECYKFIVAGDTKGRTHVIAGDASFSQHADIHEALALHQPDWQPVGGGYGGDRFPGVSQRFGPPPDSVVEAIRAGHTTDDVAEVPDWIEQALSPALDTLLEALDDTDGDIDDTDSPLLDAVLDLDIPELQVLDGGDGLVVLQWRGEDDESEFHEEELAVSDLADMIRQLVE